MNNNVLIVGGSGKGKSFKFVKPNFMSLSTSFITTDPKGELARYPIYDENMKIRFKMTGDELYKKHYSKVEKSVRQRQQRRENLMKNRENKNIYYHNQDRKR